VPDTYVTARTYLHPPGSGLDWHDDEGRFAGAYTYYVHPRWHASWGGELMIVEDVLPRARLPEKRHMREGRIETIAGTWDVLAKEDLSQLLMDGATSTEFVFAKPNRLVFMTGGVWHRVNVVKRNAPFARAAIAGFFLGENDDTPFWR
jgi:Rps23 Pro-64 3,4-dihydroxylase Tpa1-like proline 4-hydroxylase